MVVAHPFLGRDSNLDCKGIEKTGVTDSEFFRKMGRLNGMLLHHVVPQLNPSLAFSL